MKSLADRLKAALEDIVQQLHDEIQFYDEHGKFANSEYMLMIEQHFADRIELVAAMVYVVSSFGCSSHSCYFIKPSGQGVNGPCRCRENNKRALTKLNQLLEEYERGK